MHSQKQRSFSLPCLGFEHRQPRGPARRSRIRLRSFLPSSFLLSRFLGTTSSRFFLIRFLGISFLCLGSYGNFSIFVGTTTSQFRYSFLTRFLGSSFLCLGSYGNFSIFFSNSTDFSWQLPLGLPKTLSEKLQEVSSSPKFSAGFLAPAVPSSS